jgi:hypothetical protein
MTITYQEIDKYFEQYGWETDKKDDNNWYVYVKGKFINYNLYCDLSEYFLFIYIVPICRIPEDETCKVNLFEHLLRLNRDISVTKFVLTGEVVELLGVLSTDSIQFEEFEGMINLLLYNADNNYLEIMNISGDPNEVSSYLKEGGEGGPAPADESGENLDWGSDEDKDEKEE